jgi:hypothetical protein
MKIRGSDNKSKLYSDKISSYVFGQCCRVLVESTLALVRFAGNRFGGMLEFKLRNCCLKTLLKLFES